MEAGQPSPSPSSAASAAPWSCTCGLRNTCCGKRAGGLCLKGVGGLPRPIRREARRNRGQQQQLSAGTNLTYGSEKPLVLTAGRLSPRSTCKNTVPTAISIGRRRYPSFFLLPPTFTSRCPERTGCLFRSTADSVGWLEHAFIPPGCDAVCRCGCRALTCVNRGGRHGSVHGSQLPACLSCRRTRRCCCASRGGRGLCGRCLSRQALFSHGQEVVPGQGPFGFFRADGAERNADLHPSRGGPPCDSFGHRPHNCALGRAQPKPPQLACANSR
jgi:hypothetical protein